MPDSKQRKPLKFRYNRERLKAEVTHLSYNEALHLKGPIYEVLIADLYMDGCLTTAKYFQCLVKEEQKLFESESITITVKDNTNLLYALCENFKLAEISARLVKFKCTAIAMKLMYQGLLIAERAGSSFQWLSENLYAIVVKVICEFKMDDILNNETKMRIYYRYGSLLARSRGFRFLSAIKYLEMALDIAIGQNWMPDTDPEIYKFDTMHEAIACRLANVLKQYGNAVFRVNQQQAFNLAGKASVILRTIDFERNKLQIFKTYLRKIKFALDMKNPKCALKEIKKIQGQIQIEQHYDFQYVKCKLYFYKGRAYYEVDTNDKAMNYLQKAFTISRHLYIRFLEAEIQMYMGKVHATNPKEQDYAQAAFEAAKLIFIQLNDPNNIKKVNFLSAKCKAGQIFPKLQKLLRSDDYCKRYDLLRWKTRCVPFWCSEKLNLQERQWSMTIRNELREENKITEEIVKKNKSVSTSIVFKNTNEVTSSSEEEMDKFITTAKYKEHRLAITEGKSAKSIAVDENKIKKEKAVVKEKTKEKETMKDENEIKKGKDIVKEKTKEEETIKEENWSEDSYYLSKIRSTETPSYKEKIDKKRSMLDYQRWLQLSVIENMEQPPPLHCLTREFSNSRLKINPKQ